jgi:hypothetical protein
MGQAARAGKVPGTSITEVRHLPAPLRPAKVPGTWVITLAQDTT